MTPKSTSKPIVTLIPTFLIVKVKSRFQNFLKLNGNKTEFIQICTKSILTKVGTINLSLSIDNSIVIPSPQVNSVGVIDSTLSFTAHRNNITWSYFYHLFCCTNVILRIFINKIYYY